MAVLIMVDEVMVSVSSSSGGGGGQRGEGEGGGGRGDEVVWVWEQVGKVGCEVDVILSVCLRVPGCALLHLHRLDVLVLRDGPGLVLSHQAGVPEYNTTCLPPDIVTVC